MLRWPKHHPWLASFLVITAVLSLLFIASLFVPFVSDLCTYNEQVKTPDCAYHHPGPFALFWVIELVDQHNGFVTAVATLVMAAFTGTLWRTSQKQGALAQQSIDLTRKSIDLANAEFNATHRPEIVVHSVEVNWFTIADKAESSARPLEFLGATVTYYNKGSTDATVENIKASIAVRQVPLEAGTHLPGLSLNYPKVIPSGIGDRFSPDSNVLASSIGLMRNDTAVFCIGWIWYADMRGAHRQTGFATQYDPIRRRWVRLEDSSYDYAY